MIHQQIKELFFLLWNTLFLIFHGMLSIPIPISREAKNPCPETYFPSRFHKAHLPPGLKCLISGDWILPYQPLLLSASSAQSLNLMRWKLYSGTLIPLPWNCRPLPFMDLALPFPGCRWLYLHFFSTPAFIITRLLLLTGTMFWME